MIRRIKNKLVKLYFTKIKHFDGSDYTIYRMRKAGMKVGDRCRIFSDLTWNREPYLITIGDNVTISGGVELCTHDNSVIKLIPGKTDIVGEIKIGNNCFIGMHSIIMYGVTLGDGCIVGAGSVVTHSFPANTVLAGNPARAITTSDKLAEKYRDKAINFREIPFEKQAQYMKDHPELLVKR